MVDLPRGYTSQSPNVEIQVEAASHIFLIITKVTPELHEPFTLLRIVLLRKLECTDYHAWITLSRIKSLPAMMYGRSRGRAG